MADTIFGEGLAPKPYVVVQTPVVTPAYNAKAQPIQLAGLGTVVEADQAAAVADSEAATIAELVVDFNELLASLRAAGVLAT